MKIILIFVKGVVIDEKNGLLKGIVVDKKHLEFHQETIMDGKEIEFYRYGHNR